MTGVRILARAFYQQHAIFFLGIVFVCFGFLGANEHLAIARFLAQSTAPLLLVCLIWTIYAVYSAYYLNNLLKSPEYLLFRDIVLYKPGVVIRALSCITLLPVLLYGWFILAYGHPSPASIIIILLYTGLSIGTHAWFLTYKLHRPGSERLFHTTSLLSSLRGFFGQPFWYVQHLIEKGFMLLFVKAATIALIQLLSWLYTTDSYDWRLFALGLITICGVHLPLIKDHVSFLDNSKTYLYGMPRSTSKLWRSVFLLHLLIMLPEGVLLIYHLWSAINPGELLGLWLFSTGLLFMLNRLHTMIWLDHERFYRSTFWLSIVLVFPVMFSVHPAAMGILFLLLATALQYQFYKRLPEF